MKNFYIAKRIILSNATPLNILIKVMQACNIEIEAINKIDITDHAQNTIFQGEIILKVKSKAKSEADARSQLEHAQEILEQPIIYSDEIIAIMSLLGITSIESEEQIKTAFRLRVKASHTNGYFEGDMDALILAKERCLAMIIK